MADSDNSALQDARKRARRRLVGAVVLALAAAVVLPIFLESDPKPLGPDVQIQIPAIDDAKFQNRLTPGGSAKAPAAEKAAPPAAAVDTVKDSAPVATSAAPVVSNDAPVTKAEPSSPAATKVTEAKSTDGASVETKAAETKSAPASAAPAAAPPSVAATVPSPAPVAKRAAATPSSATPMTASGAGNPASIAAKKSVAAAPAAKPAPDAALPAFSLTATVPAPGAAPTPEQKSTAAALASGEFVVQLGAFVDAAVAKDLAAKAGEQGFSAFLESVTTKTGQVQRVRVGPFPTRPDADAAAQKLKSAGFTAVARPR